MIQRRKSTFSYLESKIFLVPKRIVHIKEPEKSKCWKLQLNYCKNLLEYTGIPRKIFDTLFQNLFRRERWITAWLEL